MRPSSVDRPRAGRDTAPVRPSSLFRRANRALTAMSIGAATAILTGVAVTLAISLHLLIETLFYPALQPATLATAVVVTVLVAAPSVAYSQLLIRRTRSSRASLHEASESLRRSQDHLARAQRVAAIGSAERDLAAGSVQWSEGMYRLFGIDQSYVLSDENLMRLVHPEDREWVHKRMLACRSGGRPGPMEHRIVRPDGAVRIIINDVEVESDAAGKPRRLLMVFQDVTELRETEKRRKEVEAQLLHSQRMESLGTLAGGIAHDVNNMLVPILSISKIMAKRLPEESRERRNLETILRASEHIRDLVGRILTFSRKEAPTRQSVDLGHLVEESLRMLRPSIPSTITIEERIMAVPPLLGDPGQLHQVVTNLVTNAAQAIGDQIGTITVAVRCGADEKRSDDAAPTPEFLRLAVSDSGSGMDQATIARIFEPFFTTKPRGVGTGLGLAVVHGIVVQHGGRVTVESELGKGTCLTILLPVLETAARADEGERRQSA